VALDLLAHARQLPLHGQHLLELPGAPRQQVDEPRLETPRVPHARRHVDELLAHVLGRDVHPLDAAERREPAHQRVDRAAGTRSSSVASRTRSRPAASDALAT
jgi:hypothetical protein